MKLIVGLGNPGDKYAQTRHNAGFWVVDALREKWGLEEWKVENKFKGAVVSGEVGGEKVVLLKPLTFMNLSGEAVRAVMSYFKIETEDVWVVVDDLYHDMGVLRIRQDGGAGGHNGLRSVIAHLGAGFWRWRVGVGPQPEEVPAEAFVLARMKKQAQEKLIRMAEMVGEEIERALAEGAEEKTVRD